MVLVGFGSSFQNFVDQQFSATSDVLLGEKGNVFKCSKPVDFFFPIKFSRNFNSSG